MKRRNKTKKCRLCFFPLCGSVPMDRYWSVARGMGTTTIDNDVKCYCDSVLEGEKSEKIFKLDAIESVGEERCFWDHREKLNVFFFFLTIYILFICLNNVTCLLWPKLKKTTTVIFTHKSYLIWIASVIILMLRINLNYKN